MGTRATERSCRVDRRPGLIVILIMALTVSGLGLPLLPGATGPTAAAAGPVSGAVGLGGGVSGSIDEQTGLFSLSVPIVSVAGTGSAGINWSLAWNQGRAAGQIDRSGFGAGWGLDVSFVNTAAPATVYPANGGSYQVGGTYKSGLQNYPLEDMVFARRNGSLGARPGVPNAVLYAFVLTHDDGLTDYFDGNGNLIGRIDRFGNRTDLTWRSRGSGQWAPTSIVDSYGLVTTFNYNTVGQVKVSAPARSDGVVATTTIALDNNRRVLSVTDANGSVAGFRYSPVTSSPVDLLTTAISPAGARTIIAYQSIPNNPGLLAVKSLVTTDGNNSVLAPARLFSMNPPQNVNNNNYTGYPKYRSTTTDQLFASGDQDFFYATSISSCVVNRVPVPDSCPGSATSTVSTYDSQHRMVKRQVYVGQLLVQNQVAEYPAVRAVNVLPNYARPTSSSVTHESVSPGNGKLEDAPGSRTTKTGTSYDAHGRIVSRTDETGATVETTYDSDPNGFGLVTRRTTTGTDKTVQQVDHELSDDRKTVRQATTSIAAPGGTLAARTTTSYTYDDRGQLARRILTWAPGARPGGDTGGPDTATTTFTSTIDLQARTRTVATTTADGTEAAATSTAVLDLVSGLSVTSTDAMGRTSEMSYDAGGRRRSVTTIDGLTTTTSYTAATGSAPSTRTVAEPDGHVTVTTYDPLGRVVRVTDNVSGQAFVTDAKVRTVNVTSYSVDGSTVTATDVAGLTSTTSLDPLGRQVAKVGPTGLKQLVRYDDVAHTATKTMDPTDDKTPTLRTVVGYDDANREISEQLSFDDDQGKPAYPRSTTDYDGLGRVSAVGAFDLRAETDYGQPVTDPETATVTPQAPANFPGPTITSTRKSTLADDTTLHSLKADDDPQVSPGTQVTYDDGGRLRTASDPLGGTYTYTYADDGRVLTQTSPSGTVTTNDYDPKTGRLETVTARTRSGLTQRRSYSYVEAWQPGAGLVRALSVGNDSVTFAYDADQHLVSRRYSDGTATSARYLDSGRLDTTTDVTGAVTKYVYDAAGRVQTATQTRGQTVLASVGYTYDGMSRVLTTTRGNQVTTTNTWTGRNQLSSQSTTRADGSVVESHAYDYDSHGNLSSRTDATPALGSCRNLCSGATTGGTYTTTYGYDAYDQLTSSATYAGTDVTKTPLTKTTYDVDVAGDVVASTTSSTRTIAGRPVTTTTKTTNTINDAGQLTAQKVGSNTTAQAFDVDGRLTRSLAGATTSYDAFNQPATYRRGGSTTTYATWPDGTRRSATTTDAAGQSTSTSYHYTVDGSLANDTTSDPSSGTAAGSVTASYLLTSGREARTLQPGTSAVGAVGAVGAGAPAATTTGTGVGYLLRDRHSSVTALVDAAAKVTNTYEYTDYGTPALLDGRSGVLSGAQGAAGNRTNPFTFVGAGLGSAITDGASGLLVLPARSYDPQTGRFTTRDTEDLHNRYQGFSANPITNVDSTGQFSVNDLLIDLGMALAFAVAAVATGGAAAVAAGPIIAGVEGAVTAATVATVVGGAVGAAASAAGFAAAAVRVSDDAADGVNGKHFLTSQQRDDLSTAETVAGAVAGASGLVTAGATAASAAVAEGVEESEDAAAILLDQSKRNAVVEGESDDLGVNIAERPAAGNAGQADAGGEAASGADENQAAANETKYTQPGNRSLRDLGINESSDVNGRVLGDLTQPDPLETPNTEQLVINGEDDSVLQPVLQTGEVNVSDQLVFRDDAGLTTAIDTLEKNAPADTPVFKLTPKAAAAQVPDAGSALRQRFRNLRETPTPVRRLRGLYRADINGPPRR